VDVLPLNYQWSGGSQAEGRSGQGSPNSHEYLPVGDMTAKSCGDLNSNTYNVVTFSSITTILSDLRPLRLTHFCNCIWPCHSSSG
jgi:hypothetical protein